MIQLFLQGLLAKKPEANAQPSQPQQPPPQPPQPPQKVATQVVENVNLRAAPNPFSPNILSDIWPNYIAAGNEFDFIDLKNSCTMMPTGDVWCRVTHNHPSGQQYKGWVNAFYLALNNGMRVQCLWPGANACFR